MKLNLVFLLSCLLSTAVIYAVGVGNFFYFDSIPALPLNKTFSAPFNETQQWVASIFSFHNSSLSRPVTMFSFALEVALFGRVDAAHIQFVNIAIHLINGLLMYYAVRAILVRLQHRLSVDVVTIDRLALLTSILWLLNPLHVSTVLYSVQRMTLLSTTFTLIGFSVYAYYRERMQGAGGAINLCAAVLLCTLWAALSKENGVLLPLLIGLIEWLAADKKRKSIAEHGLYYGSIVLLCASLIAIIILPPLFPDFFSHWYSSRDYSVGERLLTQARIGWSYVLWFVLPLPRWLGLYHDDIPLSVGWLTPWTTAIAVASWVTTIILAVWLRKRCVFFSFGALFFLLAHVLESTLIPLEMVFEHRNYLPSLGLALIIAALIQRSWSSMPGMALTVIILVAYAALLFLRTSFWSSEMSMAYTHYQFHPRSPRSLFHLANVNLVAAENSIDLKKRSELFALADYFYASLAELEPDSLVAPASLLYMNEKYKNSTDSQRWLDQLDRLATKRTLSMSDYNAVNLLADCTSYGWCKQSREAIGKLLLNLSRSHPESPDFCYALAKFETGGGDWLEAKRWAQKAIELNPSIANRYLLAAIGSAMDDDALVYEQIMLIQRDDLFGLQNSAIKELFRSGKLAL